MQLIQSRIFLWQSTGEYWSSGADSRSVPGKSFLYGVKELFREVVFDLNKRGYDVPYLNPRDWLQNTLECVVF